MQNLVAELVGTLLLVLLGDGVVANVVLNKTKGQNSGWIVITVGWGVAVAIAVYAVGRLSGAHLNPAVTIGLAVIGSFPWADVPGFIAAQLIGAFLGAVLVWLAYLPHWTETPDPATKLAVFCTGPAIRNPAANVITEVIGTAALLFGILAIAANAQTLSKPGDVDLSFVFSRGLQPLLVGVLVLGIGLSLGGPTGYAINPARDLGPRLAHAVLPIAGKGGSDWEYAWIPVIAPIVGGVAGAGLYFLIGFGKGVAGLKACATGTRTSKRGARTFFFRDPDRHVFRSAGLQPCPGTLTSALD
jgi:glycerol uptake facilitator